MRRTGAAVAVLLSVIVVVGALSADNLASGFTPFLSGITKTIRAQPLIGPLFLALMTFGMVSVVISTVDTLMISLTYFIHRNLLDRTDAEQMWQREGLRLARLLMFALFICAFVLLIVLFLLSPNIFYLLLSIANGPIVFAPFLVALGLLARNRGGLRVVNNLWLGVFLILFLSAGFSSFAMLALLPEAVPYLSVIHFGIASAAAAVIYARGNRFAARVARNPVV